MGLHFLSERKQRRAEKRFLLGNQNRAVLRRGFLSWQNKEKIAKKYRQSNTSGV